MNKPTGKLTTPCEPIEHGPLLIIHRQCWTENQRLAAECFCDIAPIPCINHAHHLARFIAEDPQAAMKRATEGLETITAQEDPHRYGEMAVIPPPITEGETVTKKEKDMRKRFHLAHEYVEIEFEMIGHNWEKTEFNPGFSTEQYRVYTKAMEAFLRACGQSGKLPWEK